MRIATTITLITVLLAASALATTVAGEGDHQARIVVTTEVLGSIVSDLVGDAAEVTTLMGGGADPHTWQPSARDSQAVFEADLVVANGLGLEEGLAGVLDQAEAEGVAVFHATDHLSAADTGADGAGEAADGHDHEPEADHEHASGDPHFWLDPIAMRDVVLALGVSLAEAGVDSADDVTRLASELEVLDAELADRLASVPEERRHLVTGHGALGYLAERYGLRVVGTVVPGQSSSDEPSAREVAELVEVMRETGTSVIVTDVGTPRSLAEAVAGETGATLVEVRLAQLAEGGDYADLLREVVATIASALA